jgi:tetratricopeptide (TPR) repeat protein
VLGQFQDAVPFFLRASEVNPKHAQSFFLLGYCLQKMGKDYLKAAIVSFSQAHIIAPNSVAVLTELGKAERISGMPLEAEKHLLQAKKLSAKNPSPDVHKELAQLYGNDLKKFGLAADELELYLKIIKISKDEEKQMRKTISDLREKAKSQPSAA